LNATGSALLYSTYLGGSDDDQGLGIAVDSGNAYVTGHGSTNFPTTPGAFQTTGGGAFVTKLNLIGSGLLYSTFITGGNSGHGIAVDAFFDAYVTGFTSSTNFPNNPGTIQPAFGGGAIDAFVAKLNPTGSALLYSTYLGGNGNDSGNGIAVDGSLNAYVTGFTSSTNFPNNPGTIQPAFGGGPEDAFVAKLNPTGSALLYSTYLGGTGIGGTGDEEGEGIAVDALGNAYVTGFTGSNNFPTTPGTIQPAFGGTEDAFVAKLNPSGSALAYSTYLGGREDDMGLGIAVDTARNAYVTGFGGTGFFGETNFPTTPGAFQTTAGDSTGGFDGFVAKIGASPAEQLADLEILIPTFGLPPGTENSLLAKVRAAADSLAHGNTTAACNQLNALINEAQAQSGKKLTQEQAKAIIDAAQAIRSALACP
jgi:hypothetical protein